MGSRRKKGIPFTAKIGGKTYKGMAYPRKSGSGMVANILSGKKRGRRKKRK